MSDPTSTNGNGQPQSHRQRRRRLHEQRETAATIIADEIRRLLEHYYTSDEDWSSSDVWDRTRGDYQRQLPSRPTDRRWGADWPLWRNEIDLDRIRQKARVISEVNSYAKGFAENYVNHVVGKGCQYKVISKEGTPDADPGKPGKQDGTALAAYIASVQDEVDRFLKRNRWNGTMDLRGPLVLTGSREREIVARTLCDGEAFLRFHVVGGHLVVRFVEPEQVRNPPGGAYVEGWSFGIRHQVERDDEGGPISDVETTQAYHVYWIDPTTTQVHLQDPASFIGEEIDADEVLHIKGPNTKSTVKRGISFFAWDVAASFERARVLQRNASIGAAVKAATAEIWKHLYGTSTEVATFATGTREGFTERTREDGRTETENYERRYPGMVRHIPTGMEPVFPAPDNTASYLTGVQGDLQQAVSGKCAPLYWAADTSGGTYAGLKEAGAPAVKMAESQQIYFTAVFSRVVWKALEVAVEAGRLEDRLDLVDLQVEAPTVLQRDRLQVAQESQILNQLGSLSPQTICMEAGRDYEIEAANIQQHQDRFGVAGMPLGMPDAQGNLPGGPGGPGPAIPDTHGTQDDAGGALHESARNRVLRALDSGELKQGKCKGCGAADTEAHHADYRKPLAVTWLCRGCHDKRHGKNVAEAAGPCKQGQTAKSGCTPATGGGVAPATGHAATATKASKLAAMADSLKGAAAATVRKVADFAVKKYTDLEGQFGRTGAIAILGASVALSAVPLPGTSLVPIALAKGYMALHKRFSGGEAMEGEVAAPDAAAVRAFLADVYRKAGEEMPELDDAEIEQALVGHMPELTEAKGTCKPGERSDLTGCAPATKDASTGKEKAAKSAAQQPASIGQQYKPSVAIKPTKERVFQGTPVNAAKISKQEAGKIGEDLVIAHLQLKGMKDARPMNLDRNNFPIDLVQDHEVIEVKTGQVSNGAGAQQWRLTIGEPGKEEKAWLAKAPEAEKAAWNTKKQQKIHARKEKIVKGLTKEFGKTPKVSTMTVILNPETKKADLYKFDGFHDRIGWNSEQAKKAYIGSMSYARTHGS